MRPQLILPSAVVTSIMLLSSAQAAPKPDQRVTITGCPYPGVTGSCLMLNGPDGAVYNITGVNPASLAYLPHRVRFTQLRKA